MNLIDLIDNLKEIFRPKLPVRQDLLDRERKFNESDPSREAWILDNGYLCAGDLEALEQHPDFDAAGQRIDEIIAYYETPQGKKGRCKRVTVSVPLSSDEQAAIDLVERKLKLDLNSRGCNAGVFYRRYQKGNSLYAQAVPATLTGE